MINFLHASFTLDMDIGMPILPLESTRAITEHLQKKALEGRFHPEEAAGIKLADKAPSRARRCC